MNTQTTEPAFRMVDILRAIVSRLEEPVVGILILLIFCAAVFLGWLAAEHITEHRHLKVSLPKLLDDIRSGSGGIRGVISGSGLLRSQKEALLELTRHPEFNSEMLEVLAIRQIEQEQGKYDRVVRLSDLVARLAPMFGLMGTLIPLGPGIIALGQGDTFTLSVSLLTAFDTTVAGLVAAAAAVIVSTIRRAWYKEYMSIFEVIAGCVLEVVKEGSEGLCEKAV